MNSKLVSLLLVSVLMLGMSLPFVLSGQTSIVNATVTIKPETLNLKEHGTITAYIEFPETHNVNDVNISTVTIEGVIPAVHGIVTGKRLVMKFEAPAVIDYIWTAKLYHMRIIQPQENVEVELKVTGSFYDTTPFEGTDKVKVINP